MAEKSRTGSEKSALAKQITELYQSEQYKSAGNDPYKLAARVTVLAHLLTGSATFNCKSGIGGKSL